jgi:hypothetical protein
MRLSGFLVDARATTGSNLRAALRDAFLAHELAKIRAEWLVRPMQTVGA